MAEKLEEPLFWLPSEFLTNEEELFLDYKKRNNGVFNNSGLSSRVNSVESFEDEFDSVFCSEQTPNVWKNTKDVTGWGIPKSAAEELERMRKVKETMSFYSTKIFAPAQKPNQVKSNQNTRTGFYPTRSDILLLQLQAKQVQLNQQRMVDKLLAERRMDYYKLVKPQTGSGLKKPGLVCETGVKKERTGTGVFIPRRSDVEITTNAKKPDGTKVVSDPHTKQTQIHQTEYEAALKRRNMAILAQQRKALMRPKQEFKLPQDWTY